MDPATVTIAFTVLDEAINLVKAIKAQAGMTDPELAAHADAQDLQNLADIKALLAL
jgi:hypothetical protein